MRHASCWRAAIGALGAVLLIGACSERTTGPDLDLLGPPITVSLQASASGEVELLVVEVTAPGLREPIVGNFAFVDGQATGLLTVPVGRLTFHARAYHEDGFVVAEGSVEEVIRPGNAVVHIPMRPATADVEIIVTLVSFTVEVSPPTALISVGEQVGLTGVVRQMDGVVVEDATLAWGSTNTAIAQVDGDGVVEGMLPGSADVAASHGGVSAKARIFVKSPFEDVEVVLRREGTPDISALLTVNAFEFSPTGDLSAHGIVIISTEEAGIVTIATAVRVEALPPDGELCPLSVELQPTDVQFDGAMREVVVPPILVRGGPSQARMSACDIAREPEPSERTAMLLNELLAHLGGPVDNDPFQLARLVRYLELDDPPNEVRVNPNMLLVRVGFGDFAEGAPVFDEEPDEPGESEPEERDEPFGQAAFHVFNDRTRILFRVEVNQELLEAVHEFQSRRGLTQGTQALGDEELRQLEGEDGDRDPTTGELGTEGWSNALDSRIVRTPTTSYPWRTIVQFRYGSGLDSGCSGTLIGPRLLITAAHCVSNHGSTSFFGFIGTPARNGTSAPFGTVLVQPGSGSLYFIPVFWTAGFTPKGAWDYALIVLPQKIGHQTGWMGYAARTASVLNAQTHYNRGYPSCDASLPARPAFCQTARLYGDLFRCFLGGYQTVINGWSARVRHSCDTSPGHSGSSIYHYMFTSQGWVPVVSMVHYGASCQTCGPGDFLPNWARRLTPLETTLISALRNAFD